MCSQDDEPTGRAAREITFDLDEIALKTLVRGEYNTLLEAANQGLDLDEPLEETKPANASRAVTLYEALEFASEFLEEKLPSWVRYQHRHRRRR